MRYEDDIVRRIAKISVLNTARFAELGGRHVCGWNSLLFEISGIVRTARHAGPSTTGPFHNRVAGFEQFLAHLVVSGPRRAWFRASNELSHPIAALEHL